MFKEIIIIGNLGSDPEIRHLPSGTLAASVSVAVNDPPYTRKDDGEVVKNVTWFRLVCYQTGENGLVTGVFQKWLKKGQQVFVKGDPIIRKYTDQQGIERTQFEIKLGPQSVIKMVGGERNGNGKHVDPAANGTMPNTEKGDPGPGNIDLGEIPI